MQDKTELEKLEKKKKDWQDKVYKCLEDPNLCHTWVPTSWLSTSTSKHVTAFTCTCCFVQINVEDFHRYKK